MTLVSPENLFASFKANPPASPDAVSQCQSNLKYLLPVDYVQFFDQMNGGEGFVGKSYLRAWPVEDLIQINDEYHVEECAPGLFLFGSNGGGEAFAFDTRSPPVIVAVPFIVMILEDAIVIAPNFTAFLQHLYQAESLFSSRSTT